MKFFKFFIIFFFTIASRAQIDKFHLINYEVEFVNSPNFNSYAHLYFNEELSIYSGGYTTKGVTKTTDPGTIKKDFDINLKCKLFVKTFLSSQKIVVRTNAVKDIYDVVDTTFVLNWTNTGKTKIVNDLLCYEATTIFRGRKYVAYYYPHKYRAGPWKLHGLPGLILYAFEENGFVTYRATKINLNDSFSFDRQNCVDLKTTDIKFYVEDIYEKAKIAYVKMYEARLPVGARIVSGEMLSREKAGEQELTYEWETPDNNLKKN